MIDKSGPYWFELRDREGLVGGLTDRWDIEAIGDQPPTAELRQPAGNLLVTPSATVAIKVRAKDDLAIHLIGLVYNRSDRTDLGDVVIPLFTGPDAAPSMSAGPDGGAPAGMTRIVDYAWNLTPLKLQPGATLLLTATATDYSPQTGVSSARRITIITPAQLEDHLAERESIVLGDLSRILKLQQAARLQTTALQTQLDRVGQLARPDLDQLRGDELNQRQIRRSLAGSSEGVRGSVVALLEELKSNHVDNPALSRRMQSLADELARLDREELPAAETALNAALKTTDGAASASQPTGRALAEAGENQDRVVASLERALGELTQWNSFRTLAHDLVQIRGDQSEVDKATQELGAATLAQDIADLTPQQQADLKKLAQRQVDLARQFDKLRQRMEQVVGQLKQNEPASADSLSDALDVARRQSPSGQMRDGGQNIEQNRIGQAQSQQASAGRALDEMLDILSNRRTSELAGLISKLRDAESQLAGLRKEQEGLRKKIKEAAAAGNKADAAAKQAELQRLAARQRELQEQAERLARQLQRLQAERAANAMSRAADRMGRAGESAQKGDAAAAEPDLAAAEKALDEAQRQTAAARRKAEADLARQQLARLGDTIQSLVDREKQMIDETVRLETLRVKQGELTRGQAQSVLDLGRGQQALAEETGQLAERLTGVDAFQFLLQSAARGMTNVAGRLSSRDTGPTTQQHEQDILARLQQLVAALKTEPPHGKPKPSGEGQQGGGNSSARPHSLAEVRLIRLMQEDLNRRTRRLNDAIVATKLPIPDQQRELADLTAEQGHLAELVEQLAAGAEDKSSKPDDRPPSGAPQKFEPLLSQGLSPFATDKLTEKRASDPGIGGEDIGSLGEDAHQDPVTRIVRQMRAVQKRLSDPKPDAPTQTQQKKIVEELTKLLDQLASQEPDQSDDSSQKPGSERSKPQQGHGPIKSSQKPGDSPARESTPGMHSDPNSKPEKGVRPETLSKALDRLNLPAKDRQQMLESDPDEFLPGHESSISRYYQRLIEEEEK